MKNIIILPQAVEDIVNKLNAAGYEASVVGGAVRDAVLNRPVHDWDICTNATPEQIFKVFHTNQVIETGIEHGTVTVMLEGTGYEITTYRVDGTYSDGRHPDGVLFTTSLVKDLSRRDFTINAMAYNHKDGLIDPFDGMTDLKKKRIRCVGNPKDRFEEDALRILRAVRFSTQLGFDVDFEIKHFLSHTDLKEMLSPLSMERIQSEFVKMASSENFYAVVENYPEVFGAFIPEIWDMVGFEQNNPYHCYDVFRHTVEALKCLDPDETDTITRLAVFFHDFGKPSTYKEDEKGVGHFHGHGEVSADMTDAIMRRMRFDNETREKVVELVKYHDSSLETTDKCVKRWLNRIGEEQFRRLLDIRLADISGQSRLNYNERVGKVLLVKSTLEKVLKEESCFSLKDLAVNGHDLIEIGFKPGKVLGIALTHLLDMVVDEELPNEKETLLYWAKKDLYEEPKPICTYEKCLTCKLDTCFTGKIAREKGEKAYDEYVIEIGKAMGFTEEVIVYTDCLNDDNRGDFVRCTDCGELMLMNLGGTACGECESENLQWYDKNRPEWTIEELEKAGFILIEK